MFQDFVSINLDIVFKISLMPCTLVVYIKNQQLIFSFTASNLQPKGLFSWVKLTLSFIMLKNCQTYFNFSRSMKRNSYMFKVKTENFKLTLLWRRPISYKNQSIDWFLYDIGIRHERVNKTNIFEVNIKETRIK